MIAKYAGKANGTEGKGRNSFTGNIAGNSM